MPNLISATFIHANSSDRFPALPAQLLPDNDERMEYMRTKQLQGTSMEQLCEIAGRACYDSFGRGRTTPDFHKHILEVGHLSVIEHATLTVEITGIKGEFALHGIFMDCSNRPSLFIRCHIDSANLREYAVRITCNLRHVLEWSNIKDWSGKPGGSCVNTILQTHAHKLAPQIVPEPSRIYPTESNEEAFNRLGLKHEIVLPSLASEHWLTFFLTGSRGFSHELVRHGDWTAISQRSTRYVDESAAPWVEHPLVGKYATAVSSDLFAMVVANGTTGGGSTGSGVRQAACTAYDKMVKELEAILIGNGVDKTTARKQARGAARGYLGNALYTEVVFSASVSQFRHMIRMRCNPAADAEIREVFAQIVEQTQLPVYKNEPWAKFFTDIVLSPSPDGIGRIAVVP